MNFTCQAHIEGEGFQAWDTAGPWCKNDAVTTVPLALVTYERLAEVWLCQEHYDEFVRAHEI